MLKFSILLIILFAINKIFSYDDDACIENFKTVIKPRKCCNYPFRHILPEHQEKCKRNCEKANDPTGGCCYLNCNYHNTGVLQGDKFSEKALLELYENYLNENGAGKFDQWISIVENSITTCLTLVPKTTKIFTCSVPEYVLDLMDCVTQQNFKNCPNYEDTKECKEVKSFFEKADTCGKKVNGTFIIDYRFFDE